jgi:transcriptional regulator NrdR family protein
MKCPYCGSWDQRVLLSRQNSDQTCTRRRRECRRCGRRWTTRERTVSEQGGIATVDEEAQPMIECG